MSRRTQTLVVSVTFAMLFGVLGGVATVPYVALGPGPTFDTLGRVNGTPVVKIEGERTYPTTGQLNMTTVSVLDGVTLFRAMGFWLSGRNALVPREEIFPPDQTAEEVKQRNAALFEDSETLAETAALRYLGYPSPVVETVAEDGATRRSLQPGDELVQIDERAVGSTREALDALSGRAPGERVDVTYRRGSSPEEVATVTLGPGPDPGRGYLGITLTDRPDVDFEIKISLVDVGGPSAGLIFAMAIVDKLTPGPLTGGRFVAGTGQITSTGEVQPIGGIPFKMLKAREAGAAVFLVPAENCAEAAGNAPEGLRLIKIASLDDAVRGLTALQAGAEPAGCG
ncbi:MAG: PDZ domain-containing protein [Actinomycetota bacterium]|nr:PDZ domain-containing protein [Actinomycetota bacterium]